MTKKAKQEVRPKVTVKQINCSHILQDEEEEVEEPRTVDVEPTEEKQEREVKELVQPEEEVHCSTNEMARARGRGGRVVGEVMEVEDWCQRRILSKDKSSLTDKCGKIKIK